MQERHSNRDPWIFWLAFGWGASCFFPVGIAYSWMLLMLAALVLRGGLRRRIHSLGRFAIWWPLAAVLGWTLVVLAVGPWFADSSTRLFHVVRVLLLLVMGMLLSPAEARAALIGFLVAAVAAALVVAVHHVWGLPEWDIWGSLLRSRNNFSSSNMIMMATACGLFFYLGLRQDQWWMDRLTCWGAALALAITVAAHALSRNAQVLLPALFVIALLICYRSWRALAIGSAIAGLMAVAAWTLSPTTQGRFHAVAKEARQMQTEGNHTSGVGERYLMAREAWNGMLAQPLFGAGVGSWLPHWREVAERTGSKLEPKDRQRHIEINNPHNEYLLAGMETGVPGLLLVVWMFFAFLRAGWRAGTTAGGITVLLASALAMSSAINAPLRDAALGMTLLWLLGASMAGHQEKP